MSNPYTPTFVELPLSPEGANAGKIYGTLYTEDSALADFLAHGQFVTGEGDYMVGRAVEDLPFTPLASDLAYVAQLGWFRWDSKRWAPITDEKATETVRLAMRDLFLEHAQTITDVKHLGTAKALLSESKIAKATKLLRGILEQDADNFDSAHDFLNVQNGVVDLRTGTLLPHAREYRFTKIAAASYGVNTSHEDWIKTLRALPPEVAKYMQVRYGQSLTGHPSADDKLVIQQGGGRNAKSTLCNGIVNAAGDFAGYVPESVITGGSAHPTDLMELRGLRLAMIEELPEGKHLPTKRLKELQGTQKITARKMRSDFVTFTATHNLVINTNYVPKVAETDHGTWERLALVKFPYTYVSPPDVILDHEKEREGDPGLRERIKRNEGNVWDAILFWCVQGAVTYYTEGRMPPLPLEVAADTADWREDADLILAYAGQRLVFDPQYSVPVADLFGDFEAWLDMQGHASWSNTTFSERFASHKLTERAKVEKAVTRDHSRISRFRAENMVSTLPAQVRVWRGVRFRTSTEDEQ